MTDKKPKQAMKGEEPIENIPRASKKKEQIRKTMDPNKKEQHHSPKNHKRVHASECLNPDNLNTETSKIAKEDSIDKHRIGKSELSTIVKSPEKDKTVEKGSKKTKTTQKDLNKQSSMKNEKPLTPAAKLDEKNNKSKPKTNGKSRGKQEKVDPSQLQVQLKSPGKNAAKSELKQKKQIKSVKRDKSPDTNNLTNEQESKEQQLIKSSNNNKSQLKKPVSTRSQNKKDDPQKNQPA